MNNRSYARAATALRAFFALTLAAACAVAFAQGPYLRGPEVHHDQGIAYVTGGIGAQGQSRVEALGRDMNLQLVFAQARSGHYVAGVDVRIDDRRGREVLTVDDTDPLLFARLDPGTYRVRARFEGQTIERAVRVGRRGRQIEYFHFRGRDFDRHDRYRR